MDTTLSFRYLMRGSSRCCFCNELASEPWHVAISQG